MLIKGFKLKTRTLETVEKIILRMRNNIKEEANKIYCELLAKEIVTLVDDIALNVYQRPDISIYDAAVKNLNDKINVSIVNGYKTEYNLSVSLRVFSYEKETYIEVVTTNNRLYESLLKINELFCMSVDEARALDDPIQSDRASIWEKIIEKYNNNPMMVYKLFPYEAFKKPDFDSLTFPDIKERCEVRARHQVTNCLLSMYAGNKEIPNFRLMDYMDDALNQLSTKDNQALINDYTEQLVKILPEITKELVSPEVKKKQKKRKTKDRTSRTSH